MLSDALAVLTPETKIDPTPAQKMSRVPLLKYERVFSGNPKKAQKVFSFFVRLDFATLTVWFVNLEKSLS